MDRRHFLASAATAAAAGSLAADDRTAPRQDPSDLPGRTPHTKFAANVEMWWTRLPFLERIERAAALGFRGIEFWPWRNKDVDAIAALCAEKDIEVAQFTAWGFRPGLNEPKNHDRFLKEIEASCATAKTLGARKITVVGGNDVAGMSPAEMHDAIATGLERAAPIAAEHEVMMILEPMNIRVDHKGHCLYGSPEAVAICERVASPWVKINWDLYHMQISEGDLCGRLRDGIEQVGYLQLADHPGRNEPGTGEICYRRVLQEAIALGYRDFVGLECRPRNGERAAAERVREADTW